MNDHDFWQAVYIAAINAGHSATTAKDKADQAIAELKARW